MGKDWDKREGMWVWTTGVYLGEGRDAGGFWGVWGYLSAWGAWGRIYKEIV